MALVGVEPGKGCEMKLHPIICPIRALPPPPMRSKLAAAQLAQDDFMRLFDPDHPFFQASWRRYLIVAIPFLWAGVEWQYGSAIWAYLSAAIGGVLAWHLVIAWKGGA